MKLLIIFLFSLSFVSTPSIAKERNDRKGTVRMVGDITQLTPFTTSLFATQRLDDNRGEKQLIYSCGTTALFTEALKRTTKVRRPDGSNTKSFPSGHTSFSFCGASFVHQRYGFDEAKPLYAMAVYTAYSRVWAKRHRTVDVIAGGLLAYGVAKLMVDSYDGDASLTASDYLWGTTTVVAYDYFRHDRSYLDFQKSLKPSNDAVLIASGLNFLMHDKLAQYTPKNTFTYFSPNKGGGLTLNFEVRF